MLVFIRKKNEMDEVSSEILSHENLVITNVVAKKMLGLFSKSFTRNIRLNLGKVRPCGFNNKK